MDQARTLRIGVVAAQRFEHVVDVLLDAGAALHGETRRLVEHQHVVVFRQRDRADVFAVALRLRRVVAQLRRLELERRDAHRLPCFEAALGLGAFAVTRTSPLRIMRWIWLNDRPGNRASKKRVDAHAVFVGGHRDVLHAGGIIRRLQIGLGLRRRNGGRLLAWRTGREGAAVISRTPVVALAGGPTETGGLFTTRFSAQIWTFIVRALVATLAGAEVTTQIGTFAAGRAAAPRAGRPSRLSGWREPLRPPAREPAPCLPPP